MMKKSWIIIIFGCIGLLGIGLFIALSVNPDDDLSYFPLEAGNRWVYKVTLPDSKIVRSDLVVLDPDAQTMRLNVYNNEVPVAEIHYLKNQQGLFKVKEISAGGTTYFEPAQKILGSKLLPGATWNWASTNTKAAIKAKVMDGGKVKVQAGTFDTILIHTEGTFDDGTQFVDQTWYAKGVGYVKSLVTANKVTQTEELMDYKLAK